MQQQAPERGNQENIMSFTAALYEGDSVIHRVPRFVEAAGKTRGAGAKRVARTATALESAELATAEIKGWTALFEGIWTALKSFAMWIDEKSRQAHYRRVDAYLSQSPDHADLERRIRQLERSNQLNWIDCASR
jgi:hypothetical protein